MAKLTILVLLVSVVVLMNEIYSTQSAVAMPRFHNLAKLRMRQALKRNSHPVDDEVNRCILTCIKCSNEDLEVSDKDDMINSPSLVCANECLASAESKDLVVNLLSNKIFDKSFAKCFLLHAFNDYE